MWNAHDTRPVRNDGPGPCTTLLRLAILALRTMLEAVMLAIWANDHIFHPVVLLL